MPFARAQALVRLCSKSVARLFHLRLKPTSQHLSQVNLLFRWWYGSNVNLTGDLARKTKLLQLIRQYRGTWTKALRPVILARSP